MTPAPIEAIAETLDEALRGRFLGRVLRPDAWVMGIEVGERGILGFCWHPSSQAVGLCDGPWPRGSVPDLLRANLQSARVSSVEALQGEPVLMLRTASGNALVFEALGRSANMLLLDVNDAVLWAARTLGGSFRTGRAGEIWAPPPRRPEGAPEGSWRSVGGPDDLLSGLAGRAKARACAGLAAREKALRRREDAVRHDLAEAGTWIAFESLGRSLVACGGLSRRGAAATKVWDFVRDPPAEVEVPLNPAKTLRDNAEEFFRRARKGRARLEKAGPILEEIASELGRIAQVRRDVEGTDGIHILEREGRDALRRASPAKGQVRRALPRGVAAVPLPGGFIGYAGKDSAGNVAVSFRLGRGADFWFHASDYPGCHVVVRNPNRAEVLPPEVERAAALYAAAHSRAPAGNRVAVVVARCKDLRPAPGSPGQVFLSGGRALFVDLPRR